jgi:cytochrome c oxidase subunit 2
MALHFGTVQVVVAAVFAALAASLALVFVLVGVKSRADIPYERVQGSGYWLRKRWLATLCVVIVCMLGISFFELPYAGRASRGTTLVRVTGGQFFWSLVPDRVQAGTPVRFDVTSVDVNHGFGLYDPHGHLLGSVQAMPGYHNKLDLTLDEPGRYVIRCMEFCGFMHAVMQGSFTVTRRSS